jgi:transcriptional regulator GlxA family with amidase domain
VQRLTVQGQRPHKVVALVTPGTSLFELTVAWEIFGRVPKDDLGVTLYQFILCSATRPPLPSDVPGISLTDVRGLSALRGAETVVVPPPKLQPPEALAALRQAHQRGARVISLCTGAFVLAAAGLLDGRTATTHWASADAMTENYPTTKVDASVLYVDDGDVITSAGSAACADMCLHVVRKDYGAEVANQVARYLVMPPHRSGGQAQFVDMQPKRIDGDDLIAATLEWAQRNLDKPLSVELLAKRSAASPRTFARRFREATGTTPHQWVLGRRIMLAQRLLETTDAPVDDVAMQCGLGSAANLRLHFQRLMSTSPTDYRRTFQAKAG